MINWLKNSQTKMIDFLSKGKDENVIIISQDFLSRSEKTN